MRIENSLRNVFFGISGQIISTLTAFLVRTVFIHTLGIEYLGVNGLFTSILTMLSLANLGFDSAMIYSLYKPLADNNRYQIQALMNLYKKAYRIIGIVVLLIGLSLYPFLPFLMNGTTTVHPIKLIYLLFLLNSVFSYYFIYKQSIIIADQKNHIISKIHSVFILLSNSAQSLLLITLGNYIVVLSTQLAFRVLENIFIAKKANKLYPMIKERNHATLSKKNKKLFFISLYSLFLYKISGIVINGTDNIVISIFIGVASVGVYSNYLLIISTLSTFLSYFFYSVTASVGNLNTKESLEKKYFIFRVMRFMNFWIYGFCSVCLWSLLDPFITLWIGEQYVFGKFILFSIILNFYTTGMQDASTTFRNTTGVFMVGKYRPIIAAGINIFVSIILVKEIGIAGIILGTVVSRLCTYFWYDPYILYKLVFKKPVKSHFFIYLWFTLLVFGCGSITNLLANIFISPNLVMNLAIRGLLCLVIPNVVFSIIFRKTSEFIYVWDIAKRYFDRTRFKLQAKKVDNL